MATKPDPFDPYADSDIPSSSDAAPPTAPRAADPFDPYGGPTPSAVVRPTDNPYSVWNTVGRMVTDAAAGVPDTANMLARGLNYATDRGLEYLTGQKAPEATNPVPYVAPLARKAIGVAELPEDASLTRGLLEGGGSALVGGLSSAATRGGVKLASRLPGVVDRLRPGGGLAEQLSEEAHKVSANQRYKDLRAQDVRYWNTEPPQIANAIEWKYQQPGVNIRSYNAPNAYADINELRRIDTSQRLPTGQVVQNEFVTPSDILGVRELLNETRASNPLNPRERRAANIAIQGIDKFIENPPAGSFHPTSLNDPKLVGELGRGARSDWATAERLGYLNRVEQNVDTKLAAKPPGGSGAQAIRDRIASALAADADKRGPLYGYSPFEKQTLSNVSTGSGLNRIGRFVGRAAPASLLGASLAAGSAGVGGVGAYLGMDPKTALAIGATVPAVGFAGKALSSIGTRMALQRAREVVASRSALARDLGVTPPPYAAQPVPPSINRNDIAAALMAPRYRPTEDDNAP